MNYNWTLYLITLLLFSCSSKTQSIYESIYLFNWNNGARTCLPWSHISFRSGTIKSRIREQWVRIQVRANTTPLLKKQLSTWQMTTN